MSVQELKSVTGLLCILYIMCVCNIHYYDIETVKALLRNKTADYNRNLRPAYNQSAPTVVYVAMDFISVHAFDEVKETLTIMAFLSMFWFDEFMTWNISEYDNMSDIILENDQFWTPYLVLTNNVNKLQKFGDPGLPIRFTNEGFTSFFPGDVFSATCRTDITKYPLDTHWCAFTFTPWAHSRNEIDLHPFTDKVLKTYYSENGAWQFLDSRVARTGLSDISFYIRLKRRPRFVLMSVIMPVVLMTFLNAMVFCIPAESGERMSYSITVLLAIAVFLTIVGENLPKTSTPMSIFSYYLLVILLVSACVTLTTIFTLRVFHHTESEPVTGCWFKIATLSKCRKNTRKKRYKRNENETSVKDKSPPIVQTGFKSLPSVYNDESLSGNNMSRALNTIQDLRGHDLLKNSMKDSANAHDKSEIQSDTSISWKDVSVALDKYFVTLFLLILIVATVSLFVFINMNDEEREE